MVGAIAIGIAVALAGVGLVVLLKDSGSSPSALTQEQAEVTATQALSSLAADFTAEDGGKLRLATADFSFSDQDFIGSGTLRMEMEWGTGDTARFLLNLQSGEGYTIGIDTEMFCGGDIEIFVLGDVAYEVRPQPDGSTCMGGMFGMESDEDSFMDMDFLAGNDNLTVTPNPDGTVTATFFDEDGNYTAFIDAKGRVRSMSIDSPQGEGTMKFDYGSPKSIPRPSTTERAPSSVSGFCWFFSDECEWTAMGGDDAPLSDFEIRVMEDGADEGATPLATFRLDGGSQANGGYSFTFTDDGDGTFGEGDSFQVFGSGDNVEIVVWDLWADRDIEDNPQLPGVGPLALIAALGAALVIRRRF